MISVEEFNKFPKNTKENIINMIFGANTPSELERVKNDILNNPNSEYLSTLLENISCLHRGNIDGYYYEVKALVWVSPKCFGIDLENDDD